MATYNETFNAIFLLKMQSVLEEYYGALPVTEYGDLLARHCIAVAKMLAPASIPKTVAKTANVSDGYVILARMQPGLLHISLTLKPYALGPSEKWKKDYPNAEILDCVSIHGMPVNSAGGCLSTVVPNAIGSDKYIRMEGKSPVKLLKIGGNTLLEVLANLGIEGIPPEWGTIAK